MGFGLITHIVQKEGHTTNDHSEIGKYLAFMFSFAFYLIRKKGDYNGPCSPTDKYLLLKISKPKA